VAEEISRKAGARVALAITFTTCAADWRDAVDTCELEFGGLDILVNNSGILNFRRIEDTRHWLASPFRLTTCDCA
jgi:NAD(P)-dependent dehydrogenase (short-subunit alcohol dehydrogenase family)